MTIEENIRSYLLDTGIPTTTIARKTGIKPARLQRVIIRLTGGGLSANEYVAVCAALRVPLDRFADSGKSDTL